MFMKYARISEIPECETISDLNSFGLPPYNLKSTSMFSLNKSLNPIISMVFRKFIKTPLKFSQQPVCQDTHKNIYSDTVFKPVSHRFQFLRSFQSSEHFLNK